jgi:hypothetical protein
MSAGRLGIQGVVVAHLFFDSPTFPWYVLEARALHRLLYELIRDARDIDLIRQSCGPNVLPVGREDPKLMWQALLDNVATVRALRELDRVLRERNSPSIVEALDKLIAAVSMDPVNWIMDEPIFVNRVVLRKALAQLASPQTVKQVLVVRGDRLSGKSWTKHIIQYYADITGQGCTYLCEGLVTTVDEAVGFMLAELGGQVPPRLSTESAWYRSVAQEMMKCAGLRQRGSWIIMDDLGIGPDGTPVLDPAVRSLFEQLAVQTLNPAFGRWFRLVLIAYPDVPLPSKWRAYSLEDRTTVGDMHENAVQSYLANWAQRHGKALSESDASTLARDIVQRASAALAQGNDERSQVERVHDELTVVLEKL